MGVRVEASRGRTTTQMEYRAPLVVSGAGAYTTYRQLLAPAAALPSGEELDDLANCVSFVTLYLGLKEHPGKLGFRGENYWINTGYDHDATYQHRNRLADGQAVGAYLSFPSLKNPGALRHTAEIIAALDYQVVQGWRDQPWRRREAAYEALKDRITQALLTIVEQHHPGFRALVDFCELSTPLTVEHFTGHHQGAIYGLPYTAERFGSSWLSVETPVKGLLLTGSDVANLGIAGALYGGVATAAYLQGPLGLFKIIAAAKARRRWEAAASASRA